MALLVSAHPLELYVHDCYWPRVAERPHQTEPQEASPTAQEQEQQRRGDVVSLSLLEDPRVSLTAMHLLQSGGAVEGAGGGGGSACHPHYEVRFFSTFLLSLLLILVLMCSLAWNQWFSVLPRGMEAYFFVCSNAKKKYRSA